MSGKGLYTVPVVILEGEYTCWITKPLNVLSSGMGVVGHITQVSSESMIIRRSSHSSSLAPVEAF